jgi:hypothetical protein
MSHTPTDPFSGNESTLPRPLNGDTLKGINGAINGNGHKETYSRPSFLSDKAQESEIDGSKRICC